MSLAKQTARGAVLMIAASLAARAIGVSGTLVLTHFLAPSAMGDVEVANVIAMTANWITNWGFGQYLIVKGQGDDALEVTWHCTVMSVVLTGVGLLLAVGVGGHITGYFTGPVAATFVVGLAFALFIRRIGSIPEKVLMRRMQFRAIALSAAAGETTYATTAVLLARAGYGSESIVYANIAQSTVVALILISAAGLREWTTPTRLQWSRIKDITKFGLPLAGETIAHNAARYWDNLLMSRYFNSGHMALYKMAYNLADIPATYIGEQIGQVLLPSMARLPAERRPRALERATALLSLIIFPLAIGLGLVAYPLIELAIGPQWQDVAPLLAILSALSVFRPVTWVLSTYLEAQAQTSRLMFLELAKLIILLGGITLLRPWGIHWAAVAVGIAYGFNAVAGVWMVSSKDGPSWWRMAIGFVQPLIACAAMAFAVEGARFVMYELGIESALVRLLVEVSVGGIAYVAAALVVCRHTSRDLLGLLRDVISRRRSGPES
jgi:lipopolysaccharide exporter